MNDSILTFKSNLPTFTLLQLHTQDIETIKTTLRNKFKQAPMMFIGMHLIIDLTTFDKEELTLPIKDLHLFLLGECINTVAIMSNKQAHREKAIEQGVGAIAPVELSVENKQLKKMRQQTQPEQSATPIADSSVQASHTDTDKVAQKSTDTVANEEPRKLSDSQETPQVSLDNQLINHPVRSGQRIYSRGDLTIIGAVSAGAEVIADGNIHIYGALRGRAIAGAQGNEAARIFCHKLDAELISIAGNYKPNEDIDEQYRNKNVQISLEGEKIRFLTL